MKSLGKKGGKVVAVEFDGKHFYIFESGSLTNNQNKNGNEIQLMMRDYICGKDYYIFNHIGIELGHLYLTKINLAADAFGRITKERYIKEEGWIEVPNEYFCLDRIDIYRDYRRKHYGDFLLNYAICNIEKYCYENQKQLPLVLNRLNNQATLCFYKKWGAIVNQKVLDETYDSTCQMIIKNPKHKEEYCGTILQEMKFPKKVKNRNNSQQEMSL